MCGLIGIASKKCSIQLLLDSLEKLEYRGYDSAGVAVVTKDKRLSVERCVGAVANLRAIAKCSDVAEIGIAHTRWATHGTVTVENTHPQTNCTIAVVHNGTIENFAELKAELAEITFTSQTDTEVIVHMISERIEQGATFFQATLETIKLLKGSFSLAIVNKNLPDTMIVTRSGAPLTIGIGANEFSDGIFVASDSLAISPYIDSYSDLDDGEICVIAKHEDSYKCTFFDFFGNFFEKKWNFLKKNDFSFEKGKFQDFTSKEINEQPNVILRTISALKNHNFSSIVSECFKCDSINFIACGSSLYAGVVGKYIFEKYCKKQTFAECSSEFRYRFPVLNKSTLHIFISQSGETIDTLKAMDYVKNSNKPPKSLVITNVLHSSMAKKADYLLPLDAGAEFGVVSTKAFTAQLAVISCLTIEFLKQNGDPLAEKLQKDLEKVPELLKTVISYFDNWPEIIEILGKARSVLFIGRGVNYPIALESALKFKEISYIHAEGYPAGELKHGPIALIDETVITIVIAPNDELISKNASSIQEIIARKGIVVLLTDTEGSKYIESQNIPKDQIFTCIMPETDELSKIFVYVVIGQIIAYKVAKLKGRNVDRPRNLAKSVTVE
ncbi:MAG: glutamine--fructose-6-phosphate transaminase (isomerizing) [Holosporales bacterium]|jgi:glucosamine--fructose-6-phosphate aminotransferase (isomerizing)|nr:glutamine--fructose-6-phosphate transaminase (isomerizing) [Holosporales bacterium]